jgi:ABC-type nitrate/sulfonate/bicarbonate transport system permease component
MMGRDFSNMSGVIAVMILIIAIGYVVDGVIFKSMERRLQHKWGLTSAT